MTGSKEFYEAYWGQDAPPAAADPLFEKRLGLLWKLIDAERSVALLDAGSGVGELVGAASARGFESVGLELSPAAIARARLRHPDCAFVEHSVEDMPWPVEQESFDVVTSFEVIEHLLQPRLLVAGAYAALRPGGRLVVTTPYHGLFKNVAIAVLAFEKHFNPVGEHVRFFTDRQLRRILEDAGFEVERVTHFGRIPGLWAGVFVSAKKPA